MRLLFFLLIILPVLAFGQKGRVIDSDSGEPLPFSSIGLKNSSFGTIANEDGYFRINFAGAGDTLVFSYLGYSSREIALKDIGNVVKLRRKALELTTFTVSADSDPYFDILVKCRKELKKKTHHECRAYLEMHTDVLNSPGEVIEMYYNADVRSGNLYNLTYKSGRQGIAKIDNSYFLSLSTTGIFQSFKLVEGDLNMPTNPLELSKGKMKKIYHLSLLSSGDNDPYFHILFEPKTDSLQTFSGEIYIDKESYRPVEVKLHIENARVKPFVPIFPSDSLVDIEMNITQRFEDFDGDLVPSLLRFSYSFDSYTPIYGDKPIGKNNLKKIKPVQSDGILYYYKYGKPFIEPVFHYNAELNDYQKIQNTPYNSSFWALSSVLIQSERMEESLAFFEKNGRLHNHSETIHDKLFRGMGSVMDHTNPFWSDTLRLRFDEEFKKTLEAERFESRYVVPDRAKYELDVEIYLDIVQTEDTLVYYTETVFDVFESYYNLPGDSQTNPFVNIYFDLAEVERRQMEDEIEKLKSPTPEDILAIHNRSMQKLKWQWEVYLDESESGSDYDILLEYNERIQQALGVDNFEIFHLK